jgi:hypothetical protein
MTKTTKRLKDQNKPTGDRLNLSAQKDRSRCIAMEGGDVTDANYAFEQELLLNAESLEIELSPDASYQLDQALQREDNKGTDDLHRRIDHWISTICSTETSVVTHVSSYLVGGRQ